MYWPWESQRFSLIDRFPGSKPTKMLHWGTQAVQNRLPEPGNDGSALAPPLPTTV